MRVKKDEQLHAAIIAGGKSRRFGSQKALAAFRGRRLIDYSLDCAHALTESVFISCGAKQLPLEGQNQIPDRDPDSGPLGGIASVMTLCGGGWLAVLPCDMPFLTRDIYRRLLKKSVKGKACVAVSGKGIEPLVSLWPVETLPMLQKALRAGDYSLQAFLRKSGAVEVSFREEKSGAASVFANINNREELLFLESLE